MAVEPEEENNEEAPPQRALAPVMAGSMGNKGQMDGTRSSGKAPDKDETQPL